MSLRLITAPSVEPVSLTEAKAHLRIDHTDDDTLIGLLIAAVRQHIDGRDGWLGRALVSQTWELVLDSFPGGCYRYGHSTGSEIKIPIPPLRSITSITYDNEDGDATVLSSDDYTVDTDSVPGWVVPNSETPWPTTINAINAVRIRFVAGYAPTTDSPPDLTANVPAPIKAALLLMLGTLYENRQDVVIGQTAIQMPWSVKALLDPYRIYSH